MGGRGQAMEQNRFSFIHKADLLNMLRGLYQIYTRQENIGACEALEALAAMLGLDLR